MKTYVMGVKTKELIAELEQHGWRLDRICGSHHVFTHPKATRSIVVPVHGKEMPGFYARAIRKQAEAAVSKD